MEPINSPLINRLTVLWVVVFSLDALCNAIVISLANTDWTTLNGTKKIVISAMILKTWAGAMIALFTQSASRIEKGKTIIPIGDNTQQWTKAPDLPQTPQPPKDTPNPT